jgi:hypothetical protein
VADAIASNTAIGTLTLNEGWSINDNVLVPLDVAAVQSIFDRSGYLGLNLWRISGDASIGLTSMENPNPIFKPTLSVTYTIPEANSLALVGLGGLLCLRRRRMARTK